MKKLLLLSAMLLASNTALATITDSCEELKGNWFGTMQGIQSGWTKTTSFTPQPSFTTATNHYNSPSGNFYLNDVINGVIYGTCSGGNLILTQITSKYVTPNAGGTSAQFPSYCFLPTGSEVVQGNKFYTHTVKQPFLGLISNKKIELSCVLNFKCDNDWGGNGCGGAPTGASYQSTYTYLLFKEEE